MATSLVSCQTQPQNLHYSLSPELFPNCLGKLRNESMELVILSDLMDRHLQVQLFFVHLEGFLSRQKLSIKAFALLQQICNFVYVVSGLIRGKALQGLVNRPLSQVQKTHLFYYLQSANFIIYLNFLIKQVI